MASINVCVSLHAPCRHTCHDVLPRKLTRLKTITYKLHVCCCVNRQTLIILYENATSIHRRAEHKYMNIHPPINVLVTSLNTIILYIHTFRTHGKRAIFLFNFRIFAPVVCDDVAYVQGFLTRQVGQRHSVGIIFCRRTMAAGIIAMSSGEAIIAMKIVFFLFIKCFLQSPSAKLKD